MAAAGDNIVFWDGTVDATPPTVTINQKSTAPAQADPTNGSPILFTATFSEPVTGLAAGDISFAGSTAPGTLAAVVSGGPSVYTISVSGMTSDGLVVASIPGRGREGRFEQRQPGVHFIG